MSDASDLALFGEILAGRMDVIWTLFLLMTRWSSFMLLCPGLGQGPQGIAIRMPGTMILAATSLAASRFAPVPTDVTMIITAILGECIFGTMLAFVPVLMVSGAQAAGHLASTTMGLNGSQLVDPTAGGPLSDMSRIYGDLVSIFFLLLGGHHLAVRALVGTGEHMVPGSFLLTESVIELLIDRSSHIFTVSIMVAAPVVAALFLTNFIMALISKAVPTVNVFIISFPLTIGVGLTISLLGLPEFFRYFTREFQTLENSYEVITSAFPAILP